MPTSQLFMWAYNLQMQPSKYFMQVQTYLSILGHH